MWGGAKNSGAGDSNSTEAAVVETAAALEKVVVGGEAAPTRGGTRLNSCTGELGACNGGAGGNISGRVWPRTVVRGAATAREQQW